MPTTDERLVMLDRLESHGYDPGHVADQANCTLTETVDVMFKLRQALEKAFHAEGVKYTGNTRAYSNGAIAHEVRCRGCGLCWWSMGIPCAFCSDCDGR